MRPPWAGWARGIAAAAACATLTLAGCGAPSSGGEEGRARDDPRPGVETESPPDPERAAAEAESAGVGAERPPDRSSPGAARGGGEGEVFGPPAPDTALRVGLLRVTNLSEAAVEVRASAGAEEVVLERLAPRDSALVEVAVRSDSVQLRAVGPGGERARTRVGVGADTARWAIR